MCHWAACLRSVLWRGNMLVRNSRSWWVQVLCWVGLCQVHFWIVEPFKLHGEPSLGTFKFWTFMCTYDNFIWHWHLWIWTKIMYLEPLNLNVEPLFGNLFESAHCMWDLSLSGMLEPLCGTFICLETSAGMSIWNLHLEPFNAEPLSETLGPLCAEASATWC